MAKSKLSLFPATESKSLWLILAAGLVLRIILTPYLTYFLDLYTYIAWSDSLRDVGFREFLTSNWVDYLPGYPYILFLLAHIKQTFALTTDPALRLVYKFPSILADIGTASVIYKLVWHFTKKKLSIFPVKLRHGASNFQFSTAFIATALYLFNPAIFANSTLWGQTDSFTALAATFGLYAVWVLSSPIVAGLSLGLGALVKLNTLLIVPLLVVGWLKTKNFKKIIIFAVTTGIIFVAGFIPFNNQPELLPFIVDRIAITANQYQYTSLNALNFWFLLHGSWQKDTPTFVGLELHTWGNLLFLFVSGVVLSALLRRRLTLESVTQTGALIFLAAFLFLTRMHERHLLAALPFFLLTGTLTTKWRWYVSISLIYLVNLIFGFQQGPGNPHILNLPSWLPRLTSLASLGLFFVLLSKFVKDIAWPKLHLDLPRLPTSPKTRLIIIILVLSLTIRLIRLGIPATFYFDEVYHAFTAQEMLKGNPKAWEWWHTPPEGVAYEWTHPPLAKQFMVLGMTIFGPTAFGWRLFSTLFGTANIFLVYLLTKELFSAKSYKLKAISSLPLLAATLYSVESLSFVQSRIGMNDTYMLFFVLLNVLLTLKHKYPAAALSLGLALATKWSAIYILPVSALIFIQSHKPNFKKYLAFGIWHLLIPGVIYLVAYLPFFLNHSWSTFIELQKQMYWYHTRLVATHDYSSPWWSWPLLLRPVWYYVDYAENQIANIYALGNPIIFWGGLVAVLYVLATLLKGILIKRKFSIFNFELAKNGGRGEPRRSHFQFSILLAGYLAFLLPWALSPRIMFLYHYLPSIPFMVILLSWSLTQLWHSGVLGKRLTIGYWLLAIGIFIFFYPHLTGLPVNTSWAQNFFWLKSWK
ncbi:MAG: glycosyltransferase family 39 protein [Candidatus Chisholmbacteria bacterium]|nr:glycosyltransferase family 39 protein [Candidatus Chisholmbacteria bacterium]